MTHDPNFKGVSPFSESGRWVYGGGSQIPMHRSGSHFEVKYTCMYEMSHKSIKILRIKIKDEVKAVSQGRKKLKTMMPKKLSNIWREIYNYKHLRESYPPTSMTIL